MIEAFSLALYLFRRETSAITDPEEARLIWYPIS